MIIFDASAPTGAALKLNSILENTLLRAEETDILALTGAVHSEIAAVPERPGFGSRISPERRAHFLPCKRRLSGSAQSFTSRIVEMPRTTSIDPWRGVCILRPATYLAVSCP